MTDHELFEKLTRSIGHTIAEFCRRYPGTTGKAVLGAVIQNVVAVGHSIEAPLKTVQDSLAWGWGQGEEVSRARRAAADSAGSDSSPASKGHPSWPAPQ